MTFLPDYAMLKGHSDDDGVLLLSIIGLTNGLGRVVAGLLADRPDIRATAINGSALLIGGGACVAFSLTDNYALLEVEVAVFGLCMGGYRICGRANDPRGNG